MRKTTTLITVLLLAACGGGEAQKTADSSTVVAEQPTTQPASAEPAQTETQRPALTLEDAATGAHRSPENIARNDWRHPVETLTFFGLEPGMTVVEVWPGGGWYSEVIAPALGPDGQLIAASYAPIPDEPDSYRTKGHAKYDARLKAEPIFANARHGMLQPPEKVDIGAPGSADLAVTFRNTHSFVSGEIADQVFAELFKVLKPGGVLGVVQHRANEGADPATSVKTGYLPEQFVIDLATKAGFELVEKSEINANPKDTKDHPEGVWTLPPGYRLGEKDRAKYEAIGESDRMTLKFRKPAQ